MSHTIQELQIDQTTTVKFRGNCITNMIINISVAAINYGETILSLKFGTRAKSIKNEPRINK